MTVDAAGRPFYAHSANSPASLVFVRGVRYTGSVGKIGKILRRYDTKGKDEAVMPIFLPILLMLDSEDDRAFLEGVYEEYARLMYAQAFLVLRSRTASEDAVSESLLSLMKKIPLLRSLPCNKLRAYVVSTVKHTALSAVRVSNRTRERASDVPMEDIPEKQSLENRVIARAQMAEVRQAIRSLPERERVVL